MLMHRFFGTAQSVKYPRPNLAQRAHPLSDV